MRCMKCGRDTENEQVFCESCREIMAKYPVKPGTVVQLPRRDQQIPKRTQSWRYGALNAEEQIKRLRRTVRNQAALIVLLLAAVISLSWLSVKLYQENEKKVLLGQNYFTATETTAPAETETAPAEEDIAG